MKLDEIVKSINKYKPSGKMNIVFIPIALLMGSILGIGSAGIFILIWKATHFFLPIIFPALIGLSAGFGLRLGIHIGKIRNTFVAIILGIITGFVSYVATHFFDSLYIEFSLCELFTYLKLTAEGVGYTINDIHITGAGVWAIWGFELLLVVLISTIIPVERAKEPFCEDCDSWTDKKIMFIAIEKNVNEVIGLIHNREYETLKNSLSRINSINNIATDHIIELAYCNSCKRKGFLSVKVFLSKNRKYKDMKYILKYSTITDNQLLEELIRL